MKNRFGNYSFGINSKFASLILLLMMSCIGISQNLAPRIVFDKDTLFCFSIKQTKVLAQKIEQGVQLEELSAVQSARIKGLERQVKEGLSDQKQWAMQQQNWLKQHQQDQQLLTEVQRKYKQQRKTMQIKNYLLGMLGIMLLVQ